MGTYVPDGSDCRDVILKNCCLIYAKMTADVQFVINGYKIDVQIFKIPS